MSLGENLSKARKASGLTQESVAESLGVSRQTVSKWETDETLPDIVQATELARLYRVSAEELVEYAPQVKEIERVIEKTDERIQSKVDWTKVWSKKYPVLATYRDRVDVNLYVPELGRLLSDLQTRYGYNRLDSFLVLKDILGTMWKNKT